MTEHEKRLMESADNWRERCLKAEEQRDAEQTRVLLLGQTIKQLQVERDAAHAALKKWGQHNCKLRNWMRHQLPADYVCTCGLDAALAASAPPENP